MAYEWCSAICENQISEDRESLLLDSLEIGFRHLDSRHLWIADLRLTHTEHHRGLVDVVFNSKNGEAIADLLYAWTAGSWHHEPAYTLLFSCTRHLVDLQNLVPFSSRLRQLLILSVELIGHDGSKEVGVERFVGLLNHLHVGVKDMRSEFKWALLLLDTIRSPKGARYLSSQCWELLVELMIRYVREVKHAVQSPQVTESLLEAQEWDKLECWIGVVWMTWPPETEETTQDLERAMVVLFHQRPRAVRGLAQWMERWNKECNEDVPEAFHQICKRAQEATQQELSYVSFQ